MNNILQHTQLIVPRVLQQQQQQQQSSSSSPAAAAVPFKFRRKSLSSVEDDVDAIDDMLVPGLDDNENDLSSPLPSSSPPQTPFSSSSPPAYSYAYNPRVHNSLKASFRSDTAIGGYQVAIEDQDDISAAWRGYSRSHSGLGKTASGARYASSIPAAMIDDEETLASVFGGKHLNRSRARNNRGASSRLDDDDGTDIDGDDEDEDDEEEEEDGYEEEEEEFRTDVRQTCFAVSSERGRWKSSPIPMKTHSRTSLSLSLPASAARPIKQPVFTNTNINKLNKPNLTPLNTGGVNSNPNSNAYLPSVEWRRPSTASSSLPPSSPPMSPMSMSGATHSSAFEFETDIDIDIHDDNDCDTEEEEDMLVDDDEDDGPVKQFEIPAFISTRTKKLSTAHSNFTSETHNELDPESESAESKQEGEKRAERQMEEARKEEIESLIPTIATLDPAPLSPSKSKSKSIQACTIPPRSRHLTVVREFEPGLDLQREPDPQPPKTEQELGAALPASGVQAMAIAIPTPEATPTPQECGVVSESVSECQHQPQPQPQLRPTTPTLDTKENENVSLSIEEPTPTGSNAPLVDENTKAEEKEDQSLPGRNATDVEVWNVSSFPMDVDIDIDVKCTPPLVSYSSTPALSTATRSSPIPDRALEVELRIPVLLDNSKILPPPPLPLLSNEETEVASSFSPLPKEPDKDKVNIDMDIDMNVDMDTNTATSSPLTPLSALTISTRSSISDLKRSGDTLPSQRVFGSILEAAVVQIQATKESGNAIHTSTSTATSEPGLGSSASAEGEKENENGKKVGTIKPPRPSKLGIPRINDVKAGTGGAHGNRMDQVCEKGRVFEQESACQQGHVCEQGMGKEKEKEKEKGKGKEKEKKDVAKRKKRVEEGTEEPVKKKSKDGRHGEGDSRSVPVPIGAGTVMDEPMIGVEVHEPEVAVKHKVAKAEKDKDKDKNKASSSKVKVKTKTKKSTAAEERTGNHFTAPPSHIESSSPSLPISELQGMLIESFAISRATSLPPSALYRSIADTHTTLISESGKTMKKWIELIEGALEDGRRGCGVFGKVESSFKDDSNRALEAKWFYVPENDTDQDRATLISSMMPRAAKRTETKKYKQYYYQPLDKISRWDPEDDP